MGPWKASTVWLYCSWEEERTVCYWDSWAQQDEGALTLFFMLLLFNLFMLFHKSFRKVNVKLTWNVYLLQQSLRSILNISFYVENCGSGERKSRPLKTYFFFLLKNRTIHNVDNVESSHLIKLVHAVQSLKGKNCTYVMPWKWANYQIQIN